MWHSRWHLLPLLPPCQNNQVFIACCWLVYSGGNYGKDKIHENPLCKAGPEMSSLLHSCLCMQTSKSGGYEDPSAPSSHDPPTPSTVSHMSDVNHSLKRIAGPDGIPHILNTWWSVSYWIFLGSTTSLTWRCMGAKTFTNPRIALLQAVLILIQPFMLKIYD